MYFNIVGLFLRNHPGGFENILFWEIGRWLFCSLLCLLLKKYKMKVDNTSGMIEMVMDRLEDVDEGTYTFQIQDGKATNQSSLVLIGDGKSF